MHVNGESASLCVHVCSRTLILSVLLQVKLKECEAVLENDYFLAALKDDFVENARLFIFETYCRIHQCIDMRMLAGKA